MVRLMHSNLPGYLAAGSGKLLVNWFRLIPSVLVQALSMTGLLLILMYVQYALTLESGLPHHSRIFAFETHSIMNDGSRDNFGLTPFRLKEKILEFIPETIVATNLQEAEVTVIQNGSSINQNIVFTDESFFTVFSLNSSEGSLKNYGENKTGIVVSENLANKLNLRLGDTISVKFADKVEKLAVKAITEDMPYPSQFKWEMFIPMTNERLGMSEEAKIFWGGILFKTFAKLEVNFSPPVIHQVAKYDDMGKPAISLSFSAIPIADLIFKSKDENDSMSGLGNGRRLLFIASIPMAIVIFLLSILAYVNVSAAQIENRAQEVSLRKLFGATRWQIARSFFLETGAVMLLSGVLALFLVLLLLPSVNTVLDIELKTQFASPIGICSLLGAIVLILTIGASLYTGWKLANVRLDVAVSNAPALSTSRSRRISQLIVVLQFIVAVACMVLALVCAGQLHFARNYDMGYDNHLTMIAAGVDQQDFLASKENFEKRVANIPLIKSFGYSNYTGATDELNTANLTRDGSDSPISAQRIAVDQRYFDALGLERLAGDFSRFTVWQDAQKPLIISRLAAKSFGFPSPEAAIGNTVMILNKKKGPQPSVIIAVVEDARLHSLRTAVTPVIYTHQPEKFSYLLASVSPGRMAETSVWMQDIWTDLMPNLPANISTYDSMLAKEQRQDFLFRDLTKGLAMLFALTSLIAFWGLALDTTNRRKLEYTLHFLYGAKPVRLFHLMGGALSRWLVIGSILGLAIGLYLGRGWLSAFDVRSSLPVPEIIFALLGILSFVLFTIAVNVKRIMSSNLAATLKYE